jgi:DNA polymerase III epsilon subunit family exonuclease
MDMKFIALDLETTGLSPETDTIIEIAAIRFAIDMDGDTFVMKDAEEHSQLIHPGRLLEQEVTMITGITSDMLIWKPSFESVRDKVRDFIGDAVIVGHNVLFDIAMFGTHGIDLRANTVIDTFELSEIFSQDVESLNLGFLANRYWLIDSTEAEHRALTDTKVSIRLFLRYLGEVRKLEGQKRQIWDILATRDESHTLATLSKICHSVSDIVLPTNELFMDLLATPTTSDSTSSYSDISEQPMNRVIESNSTRTLIEVHGDIQEEIDLIKNAFKIHSHINLLAPGYKTTTWMSQMLSKHNIENIVAIPVNKWCSVEYMRELLLSTEYYPRKKVILIL